MENTKYVLYRIVNKYNGITTSFVMRYSSIPNAKKDIERILALEKTEQFKDCFISYQWLYFEDVIETLYHVRILDGDKNVKDVKI